MQKDQQLGVISFSLFVILFTELALWTTYNTNTTPRILVAAIGTTIALFAGFIIWAYSATEERREQLKKQQEIIDNEDRD